MRLTSILILLLTVTNLYAQHSGKEEKWIGVSNLFFKNKDISTTTPFQADSSIFLHEGLLDKQFSIGFYFRKINKNQIYQQFDFFEIGWKRNKEYKSVEDNNFERISEGKDFKEFNLLLGYQLGKLFPIVSKLNGDIGIRGFAWYKNTHDIPLTYSNFPVSIKSVGLGLNLELGVNYQIHKRVNIGYNFVPISIRGFWNEQFTDNPILTLRRQYERGIDFETEFLKSIIGLSNFNISYVF